MKKYGNEKGLTLIEVLASLVIFGILFTSIITIFPQMTLFNNKTEAKLDTMNLVKQEMAKIVSEEKWKGKRDASDASVYETFLMKLPIEMTNIPAQDGTYSYIEDTANSNTAFVRFKKGGEYQYEADVYLNCEPFQPSSATVNLPCEDPSLTQLYKVHLKVFKDNQLSSETFSYIKFSVEKPGES
ncbi:type II secretion system protein [Planococcus chinensis]|uniref:type II secretion system protein n=1 Tax=Planococcus chinensis TaxID=272917 RepID=UPI001CC7DFBA|nr:type II secretion system protein [Planococcus chinensis]